MTTKIDITKAEVISIGDELLLGKTVDTNSSWISLELMKLGIKVSNKSIISDKESEIINSLDLAERSGLIIVTGGLGPTKDDITKNTICKYFNTELVTNTTVLEKLNKRFNDVGRKLNHLNRKQADIPKKAKILFNDWGTASGMMLERNNSLYVFFPGVPVEMKSIFQSYFVPELKKQLKDSSFTYFDIKTIGIAESKLAHLLSDLEKDLNDNFSIAYLPSLGRVAIRLYVTGKVSKNEIIKLREKIINIIGVSVIGNGEEDIENWFISYLSSQNQMIAFAESCTGGKISSKITSKSGSSKIFKGSVIAYSDIIKSEILKVKTSSIQNYGSVSQQVVSEMLQGVIEKFSVEYGIAISGIAGPDGGSEEKPVGTVWIGVGNKELQNIQLFRFKGNREQIIELSSTCALNQLRKFILEIN